MITMSLKSLFRVGTPRVTETTNRFDCGRSTGGMGTGVYAYRDLSAAQRDANYEKGRQPIVEIDIENMCKNPLKHFIPYDTYNLNDAGKAMRCGDKKEAFNKLLFTSGIMEAVKKNSICEDEFGNYSSSRCEENLKGLIISSIKKEEKCRTDKEGKPFYGSKTCSHAMNYLLEDLGFDCVLPNDNAGGNSNTFGSIILKETVDKKLGRKTIGYEDIPDLGKKL